MTQDPDQLRETVRAMWNAFDPIGVVADGIEDEYEHYLAHTETLIRDGADSYRFRRFLESCVHVNMGLTPNDANQARIAQYADRFAALADDRKSR